MYIFIYFISLVFKVCQKQFSQKPTIFEGGTVLNPRLPKGVVTTPNGFSPIAPKRETTPK